MEFYCEVDNAPHLEKDIHLKLSKQRYDKEFFQCTLVIAVRTTKEALLAGGYSVFNSGGRSRKVFITDQEKAEIQHAEEDRCRSEEMAEREKIARDRNIKDIEQRFMKMAPVVEYAVRSHCSLGKHETIKGIGMLGIALTAPLHLGLGILLFDKISPPSCDDGKNTAKKLSRKNIENIREFLGIVQDLRALDALSQVAGKYYENSKPEDRYLISHEYGTYDLSGLMCGVIDGLEFS